MNDEQAIRSVIQTYFDSMYESSAEKARLAFHPNAKIVGYLQGDLHIMARHIHGHGFPFIVVGDFNGDPNVVDHMMAVCDIYGEILHTGAPTCRGDAQDQGSGTNIDYCFTSLHIANALNGSIIASRHMPTGVHAAIYIEFWENVTPRGW